jgi:stearoyl-CoA desaturase (delta-9 desaturase)
MQSQLANGSEKLTQNLNRRPHIAELPISWNDWYMHFNWLYIVQFVVIPAMGLTQAWWTPLLWRTAVWAVFYYFATGVGITAGKSSRY